jgi:glycosyltransferase involved in cell wall biosynthesis
MSQDPSLTILQVLPALETGGVERGTLEMVQAIVGAGGTALVASAGGRMVSQVERAGGRHFSLALMTKDPVNILLNAGRLRRLIVDQGVRLVHARSRAPGWSAYLAAGRARVPFVTTWHGVYGEEFPGKRAYNGVMARGARVIAISNYVAKRITEGYRVDRARLRVIPRGVDPDLFDAGRVGGDRVHRLAQAWRIPTGARVVMLPARLTRWKGAERLLDAVGLLGTDTRLDAASIYTVLVGSDQGKAAYAKSLAQRAERLGIGGRLRIVGHCDDMPAALMLADVAVSASLKPEPFGRSVIEAQAMGRPVVAFDHGGAAETVEDGVTGLLVPPGDAAALARAIARVLAMSEEDRDVLGWRARLAVLAGFTTSAMQQSTLAVYRELLGAAP